MIVGVLREPLLEKRVSLLAGAVATLVKKSISVYVESNAGFNALCSDADYEQAGAIIGNRAEIISLADVLLSIHPLEKEEIPNSGTRVLIGIYQPLWNRELMQAYAQQACTVFSLDMLPRTTRAQSMDVLSSQANISGYKAVLLAAAHYTRYFPMLMTAAGSIAPAKVLILGAGVAGLQAVATARRLGAVVEVFDTRPAVKEEVISLGAKFVEVEGAADATAGGGYAVEQTDTYKKQQEERIAVSVAKSDIIITTAQIPGKKAPVLITETMIASMRRGSIIVDLAAATGGNTVFTNEQETVDYKGVSIIGASNLAATIPADASKLYGTNVLNFLQLLITREGQLQLNWEDDLVKGACIVHDGKVIHEQIR